MTFEESPYTVQSATLLQTARKLNGLVKTVKLTTTATITDFLEMNPTRHSSRYLKTGNCTRINPLNAELNPICHLLALLGVHHFLHVSRIRVKSLTPRLLMSYTYIYIYIYTYIIYIYIYIYIQRERERESTYS